MSIPGKIRTDYHSKQLKCHDSFNVPVINTEWWNVAKNHQKLRQIEKASRLLWKIDVAENAVTTGSIGVDAPLE